MTLKRGLEKCSQGSALSWHNIKIRLNYSCQCSVLCQYDTKMRLDNCCQCSALCQHDSKMRLDNCCHCQCSLNTRHVTKTRLRNCHQCLQWSRRDNMPRVVLSYRTPAVRANSLPTKPLQLHPIANMVVTQVGSPSVLCRNFLYGVVIQPNTTLPIHNYRVITPST